MIYFVLKGTKAGKSGPSVPTLPRRSTALKTTNLSVQVTVQQSYPAVQHGYLGSPG